MRGAHRDIWCSKIQHLMEAELFAAIVRTPCTVWPRTVMRGKSRKVNSGHNSVPKPARRTEPSPRNPRFAAHLRCVSAKEGKGSQEGISTHLIRARRGKEDSGLRPKPYGVLSPFAPVGGHRHPRAAEGGQKTLSMGHILAFCIRDAGTGENVNLCLRIEKMCFCIEENYPSDKTKSID